MIEYTHKSKANLKDSKTEDLKMANTVRPINKRIGEYKKYNAQPVLLAVEKYIRIL